MAAFHPTCALVAKPTPTSSAPIAAVVAAIVLDIAIAALNARNAVTAPITTGPILLKFLVIKLTTVEIALKIFSTTGTTVFCAAFEIFSIFGMKFSNALAIDGPYLAKSLSIASPAETFSLLNAVLILSLALCVASNVFSTVPLDVLNSLRKSWYSKRPPCIASAKSGPAFCPNASIAKPVAVAISGAFPISSSVLENSLRASLPALLHLPIAAFIPEKAVSVFTPAFSHDAKIAIASFVSNPNARIGAP